MTIQFNADNNLTLHEGFRDKLNDLLSDELDRYSENITRLEVHLSDENGLKQGQDDKRCVIEARVEHKAPIAVTAYANNYELAVNDAAEKLKKTLESKFGRMQNY